MSPLLGSTVTFANPAGLWALALLVPVVLLHLYRRRRRRVEVAFLPLLRETAGPTSAQGAWRNVHETASLLLRCGALTAAALALAGPRPASAATPPRDLVLVIDADVTTEAVEERRPGCTVTRFGRELDLAEALVGASPGARYTLIVAGEVPHLGATDSRDRADLRNLPYDPWVADAHADLAAAVALARSRRTQGHDPRIVLITSRAIPAGVPSDVEVLGAGRATDDQGVVDQAVETTADGLRRSVRLVLHGFGPVPRTRRLVARTDRGDVAFERDVAIPAAGDVEVRFEVTLPREGTFVAVSLEGEDAFPWDDRTGAWLSAVRRPSVLVVHGGAPRPFVTALLDAMGETIDREASGAVLARDLPSAAPRDVTIVDGVALPAGVPLAGGWVFLAPFPPAGAASGLPFAPGRSVRQPLVWRQETAHALLRGVDLSTAYVARGTTLEAKGADALAYAEGEPVVAEGSTPEKGRWIAFGLDPDGSDLPLRAALPVLLRNAVRRLGVAPAEAFEPFYRAGEFVRPRLDRPWSSAVEASGLVPRSAFDPCVAPARSPLSWRAGARVPAGRRGERVRLMAPGIEAATAFVDLSRDYDVTPVRPAAAPPPPAPPAPDRDAAAALWRAVLVAAAAASLLADVLLLALRGGNLAATPAKA